MMQKKIAMLLAIISELPKLNFHSMYLFSESLELLARKHFDEYYESISIDEASEVIDVLKQHLHQGATLPAYLFLGEITIEEERYYLGLLAEQPIDQTYFQLLKSFIEVVWREKKATAEMILHNQYQKQMVETISEGFMAIDKDGHIAYLNRKGSEILGLKPEEVIGKHLRRFVDFEPEILTVLKTGKGWVNREFFIEMPMKGRIHLLKSAIPIFDDLGHVIGVIDTFREIKAIRNLVANVVGAKAFFTFDDLITRSPKMQSLIDLAKRAAMDNSNVLIEGESGTGKELLAHAIHNYSERKQGPFVVIDCSALPRELVESELFGYEEGAFTGAKRGGRQGKFELANGGTVFLDEIGEMPLEVQTKLLRVLQSRYVVRVGGHQPIPVDVRIIAATNRDLEKEVEKGNFRLDLYYRLNVVHFKIPPLRERREDILLLAFAFVEKYAKKAGRSFYVLNEEVKAALENYHWPGNVRELENVIERACVFSSSHQLTKELFPEKLFQPSIQDCTQNSEEILFPLEEAERRAIFMAITKARGNKSLAAKYLGISRSTLYEKLKRYNIV